MSVRGRCCPSVGRACFFFPCSCLDRCDCVDVIGCACCLNENSWLIPITAVCSLYIPTFFRDFNANVKRFNNTLVPLWIQSAVSCPYRCFVTVQEPDSPRAEVSCVVVWSLMPLTVKAVIIVMLPGGCDVIDQANCQVKGVSGGQTWVCGMSQWLYEVFTFRYMWWTIAGVSAPCRTFWSSVGLDGGPGSWNEHFCCPEPNRAGGDTRGSEMLTDYF